MKHQPTPDLLSSFPSNLSYPIWKSEEIKKKPRTDVSTKLTLWDKSWDFSVFPSTQLLKQDQETEQVQLFSAEEKEIRKRMASNLKKMMFYSPEDLEEEKRQGVSTLLKLYCVDPVEIRINKTEQVVLSGQEFSKKQKRKWVSANLESMKVYSQEEFEVERRKGVSTQMKLYDNPFKIRKRLTDSDVGTASRLPVPTKVSQEHVLQFLNDEEIKLVEDEGLKVGVWDLDTRSLHQLVFKNWDTSKSYVFIDNWVKDFVQRRDLKEVDEVGLFWDVKNSSFLSLSSDES